MNHLNWISKQKKKYANIHTEPKLPQASEQLVLWCDLELVKSCSETDPKLPNAKKPPQLWTEIVHDKWQRTTTKFAYFTYQYSVFHSLSFTFNLQFLHKLQVCILPNGWFHHSLSRKIKNKTSKIAHRLSKRK